MKIIWLILIPLFMALALTFQSPAQQVETNQIANSSAKFEAIKAKAEKGDAAAQDNLGFCYEWGRGVPQDYTEAVKWYRKAAEQGNADGQDALGLCYFCVQDYAQAVNWYRKAAEQGNAIGQCGLGMCYFCGFGVPQDYTEAVKWYRKAAEQGDSGGQRDLGECYENGHGIPQDYTQAVKWYRKAAGQGNAGGQNSLGVMFQNGKGVPQDSTEAVKWYRKAAEQGNAVGQYNLGACYAAGHGVPQDYAQAVNWYRKAAEQGNADAQYALAGAAPAVVGGKTNSQQKSTSTSSTNATTTPTAVPTTTPVPAMSAVSPVPSITFPASPSTSAQNSRGKYDFLNDLMTPFADLPPKVQQSILDDLRQPFIDGKVPISDAELVNYYSQAQMGGAASKPMLAVFLGKTKSQQKSPSTSSTSAAFLETKARADAGDAAAQTALGGMYYGGSAVPQDYAQAVNWCRKAAEQGNPGGQFALALCYVKGQGVPQDYALAYKWFNLAAAQNVTEAIYDRHNLANSMTPAQIEEGQRLSSEFVPRKEGGAASGANSQDSAAVENVPRFTGTGFFVSEDGYLLTAFHVVADAARIAIRMKAGTVAAMFVKADKANDVALLKVAGTFSALPVVSSRGAKLGESVFTIGFPNIELQGFAPKLTKGEISSLTGIQDDPREFQISVPVQPGNSGGPLVNQYGNVVGVVEAQLADITTLKITGALPQNVNYAMKSSALSLLLESVPEVSAKLKEPNPSKERKFEDLEKEAEGAVALVLVY